MRLPLLLVLALLLPVTIAEADPLDKYGDLLMRYVVEGGVRYDAWRDAADDRQALTGIVEALSGTDPATLPAPERYALYINLYNARTLQVVLDGDPKESIRDLSKARLGFGIFYKKLIDFDGETISLNALEKRLREESGDARVHFAVNCASLSCPALLDEPYRGERLEEQLERQSFAFLERDDALRLEDRPGGAPLARLSKIFDWYAKDFGGARGVRDFVRTYAPEPIRSRIAGGGFRIGHMDYDWRLNRAD